MKKKILFIANEAQIGGATKSLIYLVKNVSDKYDPIILMNRTGLLSELCKKNNLNYFVLKYKPFAIGRGSTRLKIIIKKILFPLLKLQYIIYNQLALRKIDSLIDMKEISLIHSNVNRDDFGILLSKKYNILHIMHLREFGNMDYKLLRFRKNHIKYMNENTNYFIAISKTIRDYFVSQGLTENKIKLIYNGVHLQENIKKSFYSNNLKIIFMGGIQESKGQIELINALNLLTKNIKDKIIVDFYGKGTKSYILYLKKIIKKYKLEKNITFNDYDINIDKKIQNYDIGIMCSKSEAFGRVIVEYMTNKLITIVPDTGSAPEIVTNDSGFIYNYGNYKDLANIITKIYNMTDKEKIKIVENGYKRSKQFSDVNNAKNIMLLYEECLARKKFNY